MSIELLTLSLLNGLSFGLLLFLLSSGLTLILSMMGILNVAHGSFYMLGAYIGYTVFYYVYNNTYNFIISLIITPIIVGLLGSFIEYGCLRRIKLNLKNMSTNDIHLSELLLTFGFSYLMIECVQLFWGRHALNFETLDLPIMLTGTAFKLYNINIPSYKLFMMGSSLSILGILYYGLYKTNIGLIIQAAVCNPTMVQSLGYNLPLIFNIVLCVGVGLAGLAGVIAAPALTIDPTMADSMGSVIFVIIIVGGLGSLWGALIASLLIGCLQTFAISLDYTLLNTDYIHIKLSQLGNMIPYLLLIIVLIIKPKGFFGKR